MLSVLRQSYVRWSVTAALVIGVSLSLAAFYAARHADRLRMEADFRLAAYGVTWAFEREAIAAIDLLEAAASLYAASDAVDEEEFQTFLEPLTKSHNSILAVEWAPRVTQSERLEFETIGRKGESPPTAIKERDLPGNFYQALHQRETNAQSAH